MDDMMSTARTFCSFAPFEQLSRPETQSNLSAAFSYCIQSSKYLIVSISNILLFFELPAEQIAAQKHRMQERNKKHKTSADHWVLAETGRVRKDLAQALPHSLSHL
jgi:hypothetical protein